MYFSVGGELLDVHWIVLPPSMLAALSSLLVASFCESSQGTRPISVCDNLLLRLLQGAHRRQQRHPSGYQELSFRPQGNPRTGFNSFTAFWVLDRKNMILQNTPKSAPKPWHNRPFVTAPVLIVLVTRTRFGHIVLPLQKSILLWSIFTIFIFKNVLWVHMCRFILAWSIWETF